MTDLRELEAQSIRTFVLEAASDGYLDGRVLDYGCGKMPYRDIVETAGAEYVGFDRASFPASTAEEDTGDLEQEEAGSFDAILCTQVIQYVPPTFLYGEFFDFLRFLLAPRPRGSLVLTYPTTWPEVEPEDLHRFTKAGIEALLESAGFTIVRHKTRAEVWIYGERFALGGGVVARA